MQDIMCRCAKSFSFSGNLGDFVPQTPYRSFTRDHTWGLPIPQLP